jgi:hypothetical protein
MLGCIWFVMRKGRRLLVSQFLPLGRFPPSRPRSAVSMRTDGIARLILPEWGVPSGLIYSGCGMSPTLLHFLGSRG